MNETEGRSSQVDHESACQRERQPRGNFSRSEEEENERLVEKEKMSVLQTDVSAETNALYTPRALRTVQEEKDAGK